MLVPSNGGRVRQLTRPPFALVLYSRNPLLSTALIVNRVPHASKRYLSTRTRSITVVGISLKEWSITLTNCLGLLHIYQLYLVVILKFLHIQSHCSRASYNITQHVIHASNYGVQAYVQPGISTLGPSSEAQSQGRHDQGVDSNQSRPGNGPEA